MVLNQAEVCNLSSDIFIQEEAHLSNDGILLQIVLWADSIFLKFEVDLWF